MTRIAAAIAILAAVWYILRQHSTPERDSYPEIITDPHPPFVTLWER